MKSITVVVLGDESFAKELGKVGTRSDIAMFNRKTPETILTIVAPVTYPEKIAPLLQTINMADAAILVIKSMTAELGETIIALDALGAETGFLVPDGIEKEQIMPIIKGTVVEKYKVIEKSAPLVVQELESFVPKMRDGPLKIELDHFFQVKSVGAVALGVVKRGVLKEHDELDAVPLGKTVMVRSIQMQDENVHEAKPGDRVGVALKGIEVDELYRGVVLAVKGTIQPAKTIDAEFACSKFFSEGLRNGRYMLSAGLAYESAGVLIKGKEALARGEKGAVTITMDKPIAFGKTGRLVLIRPEAKMRIVGGS